MPASDPPDATTLPSRDAEETRTADVAATTAAGAELQPGASVGRFLLLKRIGEGGMGSVWTAYDADLDRKVALKLVRPDRTEDADVRARMVREAQALARLSHPNVVTVHEVGVHADNVYLAMEYVEGETLKAWMAREPPGAAERFERMLGIMQQAGRGLAAAHAAGMVHRDFKPANVIVGADGRVRVVDFGLARAQEAPDPQAAGDELVATFRSEALRSASGSRVALHESVTQTGAFIGTPRYMSPEQFECRHIDARSDIFSFSTVLFEATYGRSPWSGSTASAIYSQILDGPPAMPDDAAPSWLTKTIRRGLSPRPAQRPTSMTALLEQLTLPASDNTRASRKVVTIAALAVAAALMPILWPFGDDSAQFAACEQVAQRGEGMWSADVRARVESAFFRTGVPYAAAAFGSVDAELTRYAAEWSNAATAACIAVHGDSRLSDVTARQAELGCLDLTVAEFDTLVVLYENADSTAVERALDGATALTPVNWCSNDGVRRLRDAGEDVLLLRAELARAKQLGRLGEQPQARELIRGVVDEAQRLGLNSLRAEALLALGPLETRPYAANLDLESAYWLAFGAGDDRVAARAAIELMRRSPDLDTVSTWRRHALSLIARLDGDSQILTSFQIGLGEAAVRRGNYELACEYHWQALQALEQHRDAFDLGLLSAVHSLGLAYSLAERHDESNNLLRRALEIVDARLGKDHPQAANIHTLMASNFLMSHQYDVSEREARSALAIFAKGSGGHERSIVKARGILGESLVLGGKSAEGQAELHAAFSALPDGELDPNAIDILIAIGTAEMLDARLEVSLTHFRRAFEAERRLRGPHHPHLAVSLNRMAMALEALGDLEGATFAASHAALLIERAGDRFEAALQYANLGVLAQNSNRWAEAMVYSRHAIDLYQTAGRTPDSRMSFPLRLMGLSLIQLGRPNLAIAPLERALLLHGTSRYDRNEIPKTRLALARALWESRGDRTRARRLALEAKAELLGSDRGETVEFQEVTEWLSSH